MIVITLVLFLVLCCSKSGASTYHNNHRKSVTQIAIAKSYSKLQCIATQQLYIMTSTYPVGILRLYKVSITGLTMDAPFTHISYNILYPYACILANIQKIVCIPEFIRSKHPISFLTFKIFICFKISSCIFPLSSIANCSVI